MRHGSATAPPRAASPPLLALERRACASGCAHALAVALHPTWLALVEAARPEEVQLHASPLPRRPRAAAALTADAGGVVCVLAAPTGPLRALKFVPGGGCVAADGGDVSVVAASTQEAFLWRVEAGDDADGCARNPRLPILRFSGVYAPLPAAQLLFFDELGALLAMGGSDAEGAPHVAVFHARGTMAGNVLVHAEVPISSSTRALTTGGFLLADCAHILVVAIHDGGHVGRALIFDMRGCGTGGARAASHETGSMPGAPFLGFCAHSAEGSVFMLGGSGVVRLLQVEETSASVTCTQLADIALGGTGVPVWLRAQSERQPSEDDAKGGIEEREDDIETGGDVLAVEIIACRVHGAPVSLDLRGTLALVVTSNAAFAVWCHERRVERLTGLSALGAASACASPEGDALLAACVHAFADGAEVIRLPLAAELVCMPDGRGGQGPDLDVPSYVSAQGYLPSVSSKGLRLGRAATPPRFPPAPEGALDIDFGEPMEPPADPAICSVTPLGPISEDSALGRALAPQPPTPTTSGARRRTGSAPCGRTGADPRGAGRLGASQQSLPVTFHRKVKSAGYGPSSEPPRMAGKPRLVASKSSARPPRPDFGPPPAAASAAPHSAARPRPRSGGASSGSYAAASLGPPLEQSPEHALTDLGAVTDLCYTPQATHLVVATSDRLISAYRLPLGSGAAKERRPLGLAGHEGEVQSMSTSYSDSHSTGAGGCPMLLTSAADGTARLWALAGPHAGEDLICFDRLRTSSRPAVPQENPALERVQDAQFLCLDGAIGLAFGARLGIYRYQLHVQDTEDDIRRLQRLGSYKCCGLLTLPREPTAGQCIAALATNNAMMSGTVVVASSSKRIYVWDVAAEKFLASLPEGSTHSRPITCLRLAQPHSDFQSVESLDLFYTGACDGVAKLWDMRAMKECRRFEGAHVHSAHKLKCRLSPCLRYFCTPSEDGSVCIYDVRTGRVLGHRHCHREAVAAVDLHPRSGCLVSGSFDGAVRFFRPPAAAAAFSGSCRRPPGGMLDTRPQAPAQRLGSRVREVEMDPPSA